MNSKSFVNIVPYFGDKIQFQQHHTTCTFMAIASGGVYPLKIFRRHKKKENGKTTKKKE